MYYISGNDGCSRSNGIHTKAILKRAKLCYLGYFNNFFTSMHAHFYICQRLKLLMKG